MHVAPRDGFHDDAERSVAMVAQTRDREDVGIFQLEQGFELTKEFQPEEESRGLIFN